jgi:hypothetical protein
MTVPQDHPVVVAAQPLIDAVGASLVALDSISAGDIELKWEGAVIAGIRLPPLHGALDRIIEIVERELGNKLSELSRNDKQKAIRLLDEQGAFILRRAVEDVADAMKVSRITVYNYLNALHR